MGAFAAHEGWLSNAYSGLPLGEMVQWSDVIASLYVLGHNITLTDERYVMNRYKPWRNALTLLIIAVQDACNI